MVDKYGEVRDRFQLVKRGEVDHSPISEPWQPLHDPEQITEIPIVGSADDVGSASSGWSVLTGEPKRLVIENRPNTRLRQASLESDDTQLVAVYDKFTGGVGEMEGYIEFLRPPGAAGLAFACESPERLYAFVVSPATREALLLRVVDGERTVVSRRTVDLPYDKPIKIELEPSVGIMEVQINDELEYTIPLVEPLVPGRTTASTTRRASTTPAGPCSRSCRTTGITPTAVTAGCG